jgi:CRP-like cAMP-binding protein
MRTDILKKTGWLASYAEPLQDHLLAKGHVQHVPAGSVIFEVGGPPGGCYAALSGQIAVTIAPNESGPNIAHLARPGHWYGEGAYFTGGARRVGVHAVSDCEVFHLPLPAMQKLSAEDPEWTRRFACCLMKNLDLALHAIDDLLITDPRRRIAATLVRCLGDEPAGTIKVSQTELGRLSNTSRKVVNRTLAEFEKQDWLSRHYGEIAVSSVKSLRHFAQNE